MNLTPKQKIFADEYIKEPNATKAYKAAYPHIKNDNTAAAAAARLLRNVKVAEYITQRNKEIESAKIADIKEVKEFWSGVLRDEHEDMKDRLKASEFIAKTNGAFLDRVEVSGEVKNPFAGITTNDLKKLIADG